MNVTAIVLAAGKSSRMGTEKSKLLLPLLGKPVLAVTLAVFQACEAIRDILLVAPAGEEERYARLAEQQRIDKLSGVLAGGAERQYSVANALAALPADCDLVLVHDGARPLLEQEDLLRVIEMAASEDLDGAILATLVKSTVKLAFNDLLVDKTLSRSRLWAAQTPQVFKKDVLCAAYERGLAEGVQVTDDSSLVELFGGRVRIVPGSEDNIKITTPADLDAARAIWKRRR